MSNDHSRRPVRFLLVEDDPDHAFLIRRSMKENRITNQLEHVTDGESALRLLRNEPPYEEVDRPDVILLDLNLPNLGGHEIIEAVKSDPALCTIPIVVLTTSAAEIDRVKAYTSGANSYVVKPVDFSRFRAVIQELEMYWAVFNAPAVT